MPKEIQKSKIINGFNYQLHAFKDTKVDIIQAKENAKKEERNFEFKPHSFKIFKYAKGYALYRSSSSKNIMRKAKNLKNVSPGEF